MANDEINYYQPKFRKWILSKYWDDIVERLTDTEVNIITRVMNAERDEDCNYVLWKQCDYILERIQKKRKEIKWK